MAEPKEGREVLVHAIAIRDQALIHCALDACTKTARVVVLMEAPDLHLPGRAVWRAAPLCDQHFTALQQLGVQGLAEFGMVVMTDD